MKAQMEERLRLLQQEYNAAVERMNALAGALQECRYWLEQVEKENTDGTNAIS
jgi:hypothetical protein